MTLTNTVAAKLSVAFVAIAMVFSLVAAPAQAQTAEELQATIDSLMAQIAALNTQLGVADDMSGSSAGVCPYTWTRSLSSGSTGADVMALQQFLNGSADTQVSMSGAGAPGMETSYYGPATAAAVSNFQVKYRTDILSPVGLVNPTGYFGPSTMAKANMLCTSAPVVDDVMDDVADDVMDDDDASDDDDGPVTLQGEASLYSFEMDSADDDEIEEGEEDAAVAEATIEFSDGDAEISRLDVQLIGDGESDTSSVRPWDAFESVSLWVDGEKIAEEDADDEDEYLDEDDGTIRFTGLDLVGMEDEEVEVTIAVTVQNNLDSNELATWTAGVVSMRFFDADDVATTETSQEDIGTDGEQQFTVGEAGNEDELIVKSSSDDPDATTLALEDDSDSDWYTIFVFDLDTDDSINDIELNDLRVTVTVSSSTVGTLVDDFELVIDGTTIDDYTEGTDGTSRAINFDVDGDVVIEAGAEVAAELMVKFNSLNSGDEGTTISATTDADAGYSAEGADDLETTSPNQLQGSASGEDHTLRTSGLSISDFTSEVDVTDNDSTPDSSYAEFSLEFDVTAIGDDEVYIPLTDAAWDDSASGTAGAVYRIEASDGTWVASSTAGSDQLSAVLSLVSGGEETDNGNVRLDTDETATLELVITFNPASASDQYKAVLAGVGFMLDDAADQNADEFEVTSPESDYDTSAKQIQSS